jgi:hypothetical protein
MKGKIVGVLVVGCLALTVAFTSGTAAKPAAKAVTLAVTGAATPVPAANPGEPHPEIRAAINSLRRAKEHMEHAAHDFGGHRVEAIRATDEALKQLQECLKFDKD